MQGVENATKTTNGGHEMKTTNRYGVPELVSLFARLLAPALGAYRDEVGVREPKGMPTVPAGPLCEVAEVVAAVPVATLPAPIPSAVLPTPIVPATKSASKVRAVPKPKPKVKTVASVARRTTRKVTPKATVSGKSKAAPTSSHASKAKKVR